VKRLNFRNPEYFKHIYGRYPKNWTIESVHSLYLKLLERSNKRYELTRECIDEITSTIPKDNKHICYYETDDRTMCIEFTYYNEYKSYGVSRNTLDMSKLSRDEKLAFLLATEKQFELGEKYNRLSKNESSYHYYVFSVLWEMIENKLKEHFKGVRPKDTFVISISDKKYYVIVDRDRYYGNFKFGGECKNDVIEL